MSATAAAPEVAPVHQPEPLHVVRLRVLTHAWSSPGMSRLDAETLQATLTKELAGIGETWRFVTFQGRDGKLLEIRGREVIAVVVEPEGPSDHHHRSRPASSGIASAGIGGSGIGGGLAVQVAGDIPADGTAWLQRRAVEAIAHERRQQQ